MTVDSAFHFHLAPKVPASVLYSVFTCSLRLRVSAAKILSLSRDTGSRRDGFFVGMTVAALLRSFIFTHYQICVICEIFFCVVCGSRVFSFILCVSASPRKKSASTKPPSPTSGATNTCGVCFIPFFNHEALEHFRLQIFLQLG